MLQRLNPEKLQDLYYWFNRTVKSGKFNEMREMLEREGFSVTPSDITELDKLLDKYLDEEPPENADST